jgi:hypothetical protein
MPLLSLSLSLPLSLSLSLSISFSHARDPVLRLLLWSAGNGVAVEHGGPTHAWPSFQAGSSFPNGTRAPNSTFFNLVVVAPG